MEMAFWVLEAEHGNGGIRRGPRMSRASFCRAIKFRRGDSCKVAGQLKTGGASCFCRAFSMTSKLEKELGRQRHFIDVEPFHASGLLTILESRVHCMYVRVVPHHVLGKMRDNAPRAHCYTVRCFDRRTSTEEQMTKSGLILTGLWILEVERE